MAELLVSASTGAMGSLLGKLGTMLSDEYKLLKDVRGDIKFLKSELEAMHAFLLMMADVEKPDNQAKLRADAVREMSYEIEDSIDKFMIIMESKSSSKSDGFMKLFNKIMRNITDIKTRHKIAIDVKDIKSQIKEISERYARYKIDESSRPRNEKADPRLRAIYRDESELVGIDGPRDELMRWLSNEKGESSHPPKYVSIVGYGGLGKTTLARQVYDKLGTNFECRAFVSISRSPDMTKVLTSILSQLRKQDHAQAGGEDPQLIIDKLRGFLKDKRYFVIIDDIWDIQTWEILDCALVKNTCGSAIMTTTRIHDVAELCSSSDGGLLYKIKPLSVPDSKKLFFGRISGCEETFPSNLKEASEDILKKCGGLPLAINAISSLLATGKTKDEWDRVRRSIDFAQGKSFELEAMNYILSLSYFDLPLYLRSCLLYLTMFPEDYQIPRLRLVHRWIYEGFIHGEDGKDLVELGETYFHELINRSLIQPVYIGYDGKAWGCRLHDTILDFLIYKATEENFCTLLSNPSKVDSRVRRLSLMGNDQGSVEKLDISHARSLSSFGDARECFPSLLKSNALRVVDLAYCRGLGNHHVKDIGRLFQLRYLNISKTDITELPRQIGDLEYLETLDALFTPLVELPKSVTRLQRLARLFVPARTKFPDGIGNMKNLQELRDINPLKQSLNFVEELGKLTSLKKLSIIWDNSESGRASFKEEKLVSSLCKLDACNLATMRIIFALTDNDAPLTRHPSVPALNSIREINIRDGQLCWLTKWLLSLVNLEMLFVGAGEIEQQDVDMVGSIPTLLEFTIFSGSRAPIIIISGGFQQLHKLVFYVRNGLMFQVGAMPNLKRLVLRIDLHDFKSAHGDGFDFGIQHLSSLAWVTVSMDCDGVRPIDVEGAEGAFRSMADVHPNSPTLEMTRLSVDCMLPDD